ncbi:MAG: hypothetical protein PVF11_13600, partial [Desulfobacterales bacterium]
YLLNVALSCHSMRYGVDRKWVTPLIQKITRICRIRQTKRSNSRIDTHGNLKILVIHNHFMIGENVHILMFVQMATTV